MDSGKKSFLQRKLQKQNIGRSHIHLASGVQTSSIQSVSEKSESTEYEIINSNPVRQIKTPGKVKQSTNNKLNLNVNKLTENQNDKDEFPGSLPLDSEVFCWNASHRVWFVSTIIHIRPKSQIPMTKISDGSANRMRSCQNKKIMNLTDLDSFLSENSNLDALYEKDNERAIVISDFKWKGNEDDYDYYVHFHGEDRRHDRWTHSFELRPSDFLFHPKEPFIKKPPALDETHQKMDVCCLREHEESTKLKMIDKIQIGDYLVKSWYFSAYPKEFQNLSVLYICEYCLNFFQHSCELKHHSNLCCSRFPPGDEIYRDVAFNVSVFEIDGAIARQYAENLCFLSKLFLDHKTLRHPVSLFLFYVLTERSKEGFRVVGYFSKEKYSKNNLSCIMCLPQYQRKGYGKFLINLSYALSYREGKRGSPERPLSDLGKASYIKYWVQTSLTVLHSADYNQKESVSLQDLAEETFIEPEDLLMSFDAVGILNATSIADASFIFLPDDFIEQTTEWSKNAFVNYIVPEPLNQKQFIANQFCLTSDNTKTVENFWQSNNNSATATAATAAAVTHEGKSSICERRYSKRLRASLEHSTTAVEQTEQFGKRQKQWDKQQLIGNPDVGGFCVSPAFVSIGPINLQNLRWESYELHLGLHESSSPLTV